MISNQQLKFLKEELLSQKASLQHTLENTKHDKENGRKTLAILLGRKYAIYLLAAMFIISYVWILGMVVTNQASIWLLLVLLSAPKAIKATKGFVGKTVPVTMMPAMIATAQTNTIFGFLLSIGLFISYFVK